MGLKNNCDSGGNCFKKNTDGSYSVYNKDNKRVNRKSTDKWLKKNKVSL
jgi:hypothetical protein